MIDIVIYITKFIFILSAFYYFYASLRLYFAMKSGDEFSHHFFMKALRVTLLTSHFIGFFILVLVNENRLDLMILYLEQAVYFIIFWFVITKVYPKSNFVLWAIALYFLQLSFIVLTRLDYLIGLRQFKIALLGAVCAVVIPIIYKKLNFQTKLSVLYAITSLILLFAVNDTVNGARNWLTIGKITFQPSELVKFLYLMWIASVFRKGVNRTKLVYSAGFSALVVLILVYQRDLGGALVFYIVYMSILYIETCNPFFFLGGMVMGSGAAVIAYQFFEHVKVRVVAWINPWIDIENKGFQIAQSLFAIGAGGFFGTGLTKGLPKKIPVVYTDFIFSAIFEEMGGIFALFLIGLCIVFFLATQHIANRAKDHFGLILSSGIGILIAFQTFLIIGGVTKLVPSTGVTLPFVSYGGTSLISSFILLGLLQGIYLKNNDFESVGEVDEEEGNDQSVK